MPLYCKEIVVTGKIQEAPVISAPSRVKKSLLFGSRCHACDGRISLGGETVCRCQKSFCAKHRYAEDHDCPFNFKEMEETRLRSSLFTRLQQGIQF